MIYKWSMAPIAMLHSQRAWITGSFVAILDWKMVRKIQLLVNKVDMIEMHLTFTPILPSCFPHLKPPILEFLGQGRSSP